MGSRAHDALPPKDHAVSFYNCDEANELRYFCRDSLAARPWAFRATHGNLGVPDTRCD